MTFEQAALILAWLALLLLAFAMAGLLRQLQAILARLDGRAAPARGGPVRGVAVPPDRLPWSDTRDRLIVFTDDACSTCNEVVSALADRSPGLSAEVVLVYFDNGNGVPADSLPSIEQGSDLFALFDVTVTPYAVLLDRDHRVVEAEPVGSVARLNSLLRTIEKEVSVEPQDSRRSAIAAPPPAAR